MAQAVIFPKMGQTMEEGAIVKWHKKEGDEIKKGDILFEIETDKAALEIESFFEGTLLKIFIGEGITVPVNTIVGYIGQKGEAVPDAPPQPAPAAPKVEVKTAPASVQQTAVPSPVTASQPAAMPARTAAPVEPQLPKRLFISPRARVLVDECVINPARIKGTGQGGRITEKDVKAYLETSGYNRLKVTPAAKEIARKEGIDLATVRGTGEGGKIRTEDIKRAIDEKPKTMSKMRQVIARRLTESFTSTPHFYVTVSTDMTEIMKYRQELKSKGADFTVTDFILKSVVMALQEFPAVNSVCDGTSTAWRSSVNLGLATSVPDGLVVPPIRNAQDLSMKELHDTAKTLAGKAREGKLLPDEMTGSTFTVSNMGMMDVENFHAIINPGEAAILAVASTKEMPVVKDGQIVIRAIMKITLSCDHRIVDGAMGAAFVNSIKRKLEDIELWKRLISL